MPFRSLRSLSRVVEQINLDSSGGWVDGWMDGWVDEEYILTSTYRCRCDLKRLGC